MVEFNQQKENDEDNIVKTSSNTEIDRFDNNCFGMKDKHSYSCKKWKDKGILFLHTVIG